MRRKRICVLIMLVCLAAAAGCTSLPGAKGAISGTVVLEGESVHSGVLVKLKERNTTVTTDVHGNYSFQKLPDGVYTLQFSREGFNSTAKTVTIHEGFAVAVDTVTLTRITHNPKKAELFGHSCYFDFDTGQVTTNIAEGDIRLDAFSIYQNTYLLHLDEMDACQFEEEYNDNGGHTFNQFALVDSTAHSLERKSFNFYIGDVFLLKTTQDKFVKLLIYDYNNDHGTTGAPSVQFVYLYDQIVDTSGPVLKEIKLYTDSGEEYTQTPGGEVTFAVHSRPARIQFVFDEFVRMNPFAFLSFNQESPLYWMTDNPYIPYYDSLTAEIFNGDWGIGEPGTYTLSFNAGDYYFVDMSGNQMTLLPFNSLTIQYTGE